MSDMNDVIGRAIADEKFRAALLSDPKAANAEYELGLDDAQIESIGKLDAATIEASLTSGDADLSAE